MTYKRLLLASVLLINVGLAGLFFKQGVSWRFESRSIQPGVRHEYLINLDGLVRFPFELRFDSSKEPSVSTLIVTEDGKALGPAHALHADIRGAGSGAYSHWADALHFSSSDNSDPRSNGRAYSGLAELRIQGRVTTGFLGFGCLLLATSIALWSRAAVKNGKGTAATNIPVTTASVPPALGNITAGEPRVAVPASTLTIGKAIVFSVTTLLLIVVVSVGILFTLEIAWRLFGGVASKGALVDVELFPYKHYVVTSQPANLVLGRSNSPLEAFFSHDECDAPGGVKAAFNADGFRSPDIRSLPVKEDGEIRIIITGGSVSISWNVGEACTLDNRLRHHFATKYPQLKVRIINLGSGAWKSFQELIALQLYGLKLQPDLVIALDGFNDIQHAYSMPIDQPYSNTAEVAFQRYRAWVNGGLQDLVASLKIVSALKTMFHPPSEGIAGRTSTDVSSIKYPESAASAEPGKLATQMHVPVNELMIATRTDFDPYNRQVVDNYLRNERLIASSAATAGAKVLIALQPTLYLKTPLAESERRSLDSYAPSVNFVVQGYSRMRQGLRSLAGEAENVTFIDLSRVFNERHQAVFFDYTHFNAAGYDIVADRIFASVEELLKLRSTTPAIGVDSNAVRRE